MNDNPIKFIDLLTKYNKIVIPQIQRDYAQGRDDEHAKDVCKSFLDSIFEILNDNKEDKKLDLNFIYGVVEERDDDRGRLNCFIPLDGQQRLTTLFLLHWYFEVEELCDNENAKFTYETRHSSNEFCCNLVKNKPMHGKALACIKDSMWYLNIWKNDPTVASMLNMIDAIDKKFSCLKDNKNVKDRLDLINFSFLPLDKTDADMTYVRMNSRGLPLTAFENFKANIEKILKSSHGETGFNTAWKRKMDGVWLDVFWNLVNKDKKQEEQKILPDASMIRFISRCMAAYWITNAKKRKDENGYIVIDADGTEKPTDIELLDKNLSPLDALLQINGNENYIPQDIFLRAFSLSGAFEYMDFIFDLIVDEKNQCWDTLFSPVWDEDLKKKTLADFVIKDPTYELQAAFLAMVIFKYNGRAEPGTGKYGDWMRVVWNIIGNTDINQKSFIGFVHFLDELGKSCLDIYSFLATEPENISFAKEQIKEEIKKAKLIKSGTDNWEYEIREAEKNPFFHGAIPIHIYNLNKDDIEKFKKRKEKLEGIFGKTDATKEYHPIIIQNVISRIEKWDYLFGIWGKGGPCTFENIMSNWHKLFRCDKFAELFVALIDTDMVSNKLKEPSKITWDNNNEHNTMANRVRDWLCNSNILKYIPPASQLQWRGDHIWFHARNAQYNWFLADSPRNQILKKLHYDEPPVIRVENGYIWNDDFFHEENIQFYYNNKKYIFTPDNIKSADFKDTLYKLKFRYGDLPEEKLNMVCYEIKEKLEADCK